MDKKDNSVPNKPGSPLRIGPNGLPVFASRGRVLTPEMIKQAEEDDLNYEIARMLRLGGRPLKKASPIEDEA